MAKGPKVSHPEYVDFNSDEDDLLGDDDLLVDNSSDEYYDETSNNHAHQDKTNDNDKEKIECLTKELNTLKLAHETILEDHRELLKSLVTRTRNILPLAVTMIMLNPILLLLVVLLIPLMILLAKLHLSKKIAY